MILRRLLPFALLLPMLLGLFLVPAYAQDDSESPSEEQQSEGTKHFVEVGDDGYNPSELTIKPGDRVVWVWVDDGPHSVTAKPDEANARAFDSHPNCSAVLFIECGTNGDTFVEEKAFQQVGNFPYSSRHEADAETHDGVVLVIAPEPTTSPSPTEDESTEDGSTEDESTEEPSRGSSREPTEEANEPSETSSTGDPTAEPTESQTPTEEPTATPPPAPQRGNAPNFAQNSRPVPRPEPAEEPLVAGSFEAEPLPEATFEAFPSPAAPGSLLSDEPTDEATDEDLGVVELPSDDGPSERLVWGLVGGGFLAATTSLFGKFVLFGQAWA